VTAFAIYRRLFRFARPYWLHLVGLLALSLAATPIALLTPFPLKVVVDTVIGRQPLPAFLERMLPAGVAGSQEAVLLLAIGMMLVIALLSMGQQLTRSLLNTRVAEELVLRFRSELFAHMQRLSLAYHDMKGSSDSLYRIQYDAMAIQYIAIDGIIPFVASSATLVSMVYVTVRLDATLALVALGIMPLVLLILHHYRPQLREQSRQVKKLETSAMSVIQEVLGAVRVVKAFGQEGKEQNRFASHSGAGLTARVRLAYVQSLMSVWIGVIIAIGSAVVLYLGARHVQNGTLTLGNLLLVIGYISSLYGPLRTVSGRIGRLQSHLASAERAFELLDERPDVVERPGAKPIVRATGAVTFQDVSFSYDGQTPVLQGMDIDIDPGTCVGIVGRTGAGKTTLANLLLRFYDPTGGRILLDNEDLRDYRVADLRDQFSIVLQDAVLFSTTIGENISYAKTGASDEEIVAAARNANAHEFILSLPDGYNTLVGERGLRLSGGERQRVSIARAFLKDAPLLILDEPTSSVDAGTESSIMEAMQRLVRGRTTFLITHRQSTLTYADVVVSIESGHVTRLSAADPSTKPIVAGMSVAASAGD